MPETYEPSEKLRLFIYFVILFAIAYVIYTYYRDRSSISDLSDLLYVSIAGIGLGLIFGTVLVLIILYGPALGGLLTLHRPQTQIAEAEAGPAQDNDQGTLSISEEFSPLEPTS